MGRDKQTFTEAVNGIKHDFFVNMMLASDSRSIFDSNKEEWISQLDSLLTVPEHIEDKDEMLDWIEQNKILLAALNDAKMRSKVKDPVYHEMFDKTADIRGLIDDWIDVYEKNSDLLLNEDGSAAEAKPGTPEAEAKAKLDAVKNNFTAYKAAQKEGKPFQKITDPGAEQKKAENLKAVMMSDRAKFEEFGKLLHNARTFWNSDEYNDIEDMVSAFGKGIEISKLPDKRVQKAAADLGEREQHALKLFLIKDKLDAYITHKAKDGVKPNVFKKLAEVERLNKFVADRLRELHPQDIKFGEVVYSVSNIKGSYQEEYEAAAVKDELLADYSKDEDIDKIVAYGANWGSKPNDDLKNAGACMDRIMLKAQTVDGALDNIPALQEAKKLIYAEQLVPHLNKKAVATMAAAKNAVEKGFEAMLPDQKTIDLLEHENVKALSSDPKEKFLELRAFYIAQNIAKDQKYSMIASVTGASKTASIIETAEPFTHPDAYKHLKREMNTNLIHGS